jgi:hypothetical protein
MGAKVERVRTLHRTNNRDGKAMREKGGKEINRGTEE